MSQLKVNENGYRLKVEEAKERTGPQKCRSIMKKERG
jgi:hypothetical protein